jgi:uncharacterized membrane protein YhfC
MLTFTLVLEMCIMIGLPILLALLWRKRFSLPWLLILLGALIFIISQIVHIPLLAWLTSLFSEGILPAPSAEAAPLFNAAVLGLLAGLCEETARWIGIRWLSRSRDVPNNPETKPAQLKPISLQAAILLGIGHGGIESIILGGGLLVNTVALWMVRTGQTAIPGVTPIAVDSFFSTAWHLPLAGAMERVTTIVLHVFLTVLVWLAVNRRSFGWYALAVFYHAVLDGLAVYLNYAGTNVWLIEGLLFVFGLVNLFLLVRIWHRQVESPANGPI